MRYLLLLACAVLLSQGVLAARVDTVEVFSDRMQKHIKTVVIQPEEITAGIRLPTVYLLHGYSGSYRDFTNRVTDLHQWVDQFNFVIVCPDGGFSSWYWDTEDPAFRYETFVSKELTAFIAANYPVNDVPNARAVTGFSMGGHGALYLALRNQDVFGVAGSMAGGVDFRPFPDNWHIAQRLGAYHENPIAWDQHTVIELIHLFRPNQLPVYIDCGDKDFFYEVNKKLHEKLTYHNVPHQFHSRPGKHDWAYVNQALPHQLLFFSEFFNQETGE